MALYDQGDVARLFCTFTKLQRDGRRQKVDPTSIRCKVLDPARRLTVYTFGSGPEIVKDGIGDYHLDVAVSQVGEWLHRWIGAGAVAAADEEKLTVKSSAFSDPS